MPNYKETTVSGTKWQRGCRIIIENPLDQTPQVTYVEEEITVVGEEKIHRLVGSLQASFDYPDLSIPMIDPVTNEKTTTEYPLSLAQWILYSYYWYLADKRDNPPATEPTIPSA